MIDDFEIKLNSKLGKELLFTKDRFERGSYLWKKGDYVYISFIVSKISGMGYLSDLFKKIQSKGWGIKVPTPFTRMESICKAKDFIKTEEWFKEMNCPVEVWVKDLVQNSLLKEHEK